MNPYREAPLQKPPDPAATLLKKLRLVDLEHRKDSWLRLSAIYLTVSMLQTAITLAFNPLDASVCSYVVHWGRHMVLAVQAHSA